MPLHNPQSQKGILYMAFNQDYTCISLADYKGIKIYSIDTHKICYQADVGAVSIAEMLFCTSLMAFVGAGEQPALTPRKLTLMNTTAQNIVQDLNFPSSVLAVRMNRKRLVAVLEKRTYVHALETLELLQTLETVPNPKGRCALTLCSDPCLLALPSSTTTGSLRVYDTLVDGGNVICEINAHKTPAAVLAWNAEGTLLASASQKGTILRVHRLPQANKAWSFRRGSTSAAIHSLAFSPPGVQPPLLCAASGHGTVHLFRLEEPDRHPGIVAASGLLAAVMPPAVADVMEPPRCIATVRLPCQGVPALCALQSTSPGTSTPTSGRDGPFAGSARASPDLSSSEDSGLGGSYRSLSGSMTRSDAVKLVVATAEGLLYEYQVSGLRGPAAPACTLDGESYLLGRTEQAL
ncbi:hypothetical protein WJX72_008472 [[Myrmecia] bisecta]|uniref:Autophagy-related protein 18 n=1 Tax=[Myrmecia] bisecta TaxID=41462 RepID=A0AAW1P5N7_9CHLO